MNAGLGYSNRYAQLEEYYLTRTEIKIMRTHAAEMGEQIGPGVMLVEYGSGSSIKTRLLLDHLPDPVAYVPVDISGDHLESVAGQLANDYPNIEVLPVCADFTRPFCLPKSNRAPTHAAVYFPGSTIGNFVPQKAKELLQRIVPLCGRGGGLLIGIDLQKDAATIEAAYNDQLGVTSAFNLNLLEHINRELDADVEMDAFAPGVLQRAAGASRDLHSQPRESSGDHRRPGVYLCGRRADSHRVFAQIHD